MIRIYPEIDFEAYCPEDSELLIISRVVIPGMRCLVEASCPSCGALYYIDLPVGQALRSPATIDQKTGKIFDSRDVSWFSNLLKDAHADQILMDIVPTVHTFFSCDRIVILNCLDFLYGHSLLKLLNAQRYLDEPPDIGLCVLVPTQLLHLVPEGVAEIWEFPVRIQDGWKWYKSLQSWIHTQLLSRRECFLSRAYSHPSNRIYDLDRLIPNLPDISSQIQGANPLILFSYRDDRPWGRDQSHQQRNLQKLYDRLGGVFPNMFFVLIGFGNCQPLYESGPTLVDLRSDRFSKDQDLLWLAYMQKAACAIGVHGSNMLLPSGFAKTTVALVPRSRLGNSVQDFLFSSLEYDNRDSLLNYRMMYGNDDLSDIRPSEVVDMVACALSSAAFNSSWFKVGEEEGAISRANAISETEVYIRAKQYFNRCRNSSFLKRHGRKIAESIMEMID